LELIRVVGIVQDPSINSSFKYGQIPLIITTRKKRGYMWAFHMFCAVFTRLKVNSDGREKDFEPSFNDMYKSTVAPLPALPEKSNIIVQMISIGTACLEIADMAVLCISDPLEFDPSKVFVALSAPESWSSMLCETSNGSAMSVVAKSSVLAPLDEEQRATRRKLALKATYVPAHTSITGRSNPSLNPSSRMGGSSSYPNFLPPVQYPSACSKVECVAELMLFRRTFIVHATMEVIAEATSGYSTVSRKAVKFSKPEVPVTLAVTFPRKYPIRDTLRLL